MLATSPALEGGVLFWRQLSLRRTEARWRRSPVRYTPRQPSRRVPGVVSFDVPVHVVNHVSAPGGSRVRTASPNRLPLELSLQIGEDVVGAKQTDVSTGPAVTGERHVNGDDANGLTEHGLSELLHALQAMRVGDFSVRMAGDRVGLIGKVADTFNDIVATNQRMAQQLERVGQVVGREGRTRQRVRLGLSDGAWGEMESSVNSLIDDLLWPTTEVTRAVAAVAQGDLLQTVQLDVDGRPLKGEFLRSAEIVNTMIKQLNVFTSEVTRVAREVGTEGKLGGQAQVGGVTGVWKDLTESVNSMASNLTAQVRNIAEVTIAVANGDLSKKITVDVRGEILQLKEAINTMVDQLRSFASEVTRVAREVGSDGTLGGQADRAWRRRHLEGSDRLGQCHVRQPHRPGANICHVTTAVARGDLSRKITVDVRGEILELKDTINTMVDQLIALPPKSRALPARSAPKASSAAKRRSPESSGMEGVDGQRQLHGLQPHRAGPQHRRSNNGYRRRRFVEEDHGQRQRRNSAIERNHQHDGGSAQCVRRRGHPRGARSRHRRQARRSSQRPRRRRHVEGFDRHGD